MSAYYVWLKIRNQFYPKIQFSKFYNPYIAKSLVPYFLSILIKKIIWKYDILDFIHPDPDGPGEQNSPPVRVYCDMKTGATRIQHNQGEQVSSVVQVCFNHVVIYDTSNSKIQWSYLLKMKLNPNIKRKYNLLKYRR